MKYAILIYHNPASRQVWERLSDAERTEGLGVYAALNEDLVASGELIVTEALADPTQAKRVSVHEGQAITTDGPFAEVKEHLAGFYLIECDSMERALEVAARVPEAALRPPLAPEHGLIEVRPVMDYNIGP
jgi:hypothetical protein